MPRSGAGGGRALLVVYGATWLLTARENEVASTNGAGKVNGTSNGHKRPLNGMDVDHNDADKAATGGEAGLPYWTVRLTHRYQPLVHVGPLRVADDEPSAAMGLAVVEKPIFGLVEGMDKAWKRQRKYGR